MEKTILNFHFDYLQISFIKIWWCVNPKVDVNEWPIFLHRLTDNFFALKYMSEQRRLHIEKTFQGCSSPQALSDPLHIQFLLSALTRRAIRALSKNWVRVPTAYPSPSQRSLSWSNLRLRCWWFEFWSDIMNSSLQLTIDSRASLVMATPMCMCVLSSYLYHLVDVAFLLYVSCSVRRWWVPPGHGASSGVSQSGSHLSAHMYPPPIKKYKVRGIKIEILKWLIYVFSYSIIVTNMRTVVMKKRSSLSMCRYLWNWKHLLYQMIM